MIVIFVACYGAAYFHATRRLLLCRVLYVPGPSTIAYARGNFRHLRVDQQYPGVL